MWFIFDVCYGPWLSDSHCPKADLMLIAHLFGTYVPLNERKAEIKQCVAQRLVEEGKVIPQNSWRCRGCTIWRGSGGCHVSTVPHLRGGCGSGGWRRHRTERGSTRWRKNRGANAKSLFFFYKWCSENSLSFVKSSR